MLSMLWPGVLDTTLDTIRTLGESSRYSRLELSILVMLSVLSQRVLRVSKASMGLELCARALDNTGESNSFY